MLGVDQVIHFLTSVVAIAAALLFVAFLVWLIRHSGYGGAIDLAEILESIFGIKVGTLRQLSPVNVPFLDAQGVSMVFGTFIEVTMQNGHGNLCNLCGGTFGGCDPRWIKAGAYVEVSYQQGQYTEKLRVRLNHTEQHLFLKSKHTIAEILRLIDGGEQPVC